MEVIIRIRGVPPLITSVTVNYRPALVEAREDLGLVVYHSTREVVSLEHPFVNRSFAQNPVPNGKNRFRPLWDDFQTDCAPFTRNPRGKVPTHARAGCDEKGLAPLFTKLSLVKGGMFRPLCPFLRGVAPASQGSGEGKSFSRAPPIPS